MSETTDVGVGSLVRWLTATDVALSAWTATQVHGSSVSLESMMTALYGPDKGILNYSTEGVVDWVKEKTQSLVDKIKSVMTRVKNKFDHLMSKITGKQKEIEADPYSTYVTSASPDATSKGFTAAHAGLAAIAVLAGFFLIRGSQVTASVALKNREFAKRNSQKLENKKEELNKELENSDEAKRVKRAESLSGKTWSFLSSSYRAKKEHALQDFNNKKAEYEATLQKMRKDNAEKEDKLKKRMQSRFAYYWTAKNLSSALGNIKGLIDGIFTAIVNFIQKFTQALTQRDTGLGRIGLFRWVGMVTKDIVVLIGSSIWSVLSSVAGVIFGSKPSKKGDKDKKPEDDSGGEKKENTDEQK